MECDCCGNITDFIQLEDNTYICKKCISGGHILDNKGLCWCNPILEVFEDGHQIWIHRQLD